MSCEDLGLASVERLAASTPAGGGVRRTASSGAARRPGAGTGGGRRPRSGPCAGPLPEGTQ